MEAEVKIKASMQMVENNLEAQAKKQGQKAGRAFQEGAKRTGKGGIFDMLKSSGGVLNGLKGVLTGGGIKSLLNPSMLLKAVSGPIGIAMTGVSLAFLALRNRFEAQQKLIERRISASMQIIADRQGAMHKSEEKSSQLISILEKLYEYQDKVDSGQILSDSEVNNALMLIKKLNLEFDMTDVKVNTLTRSIQGLNKALLKTVQEKAMGDKLKQLQKINDEYKNVSELLTNQAIGELNWDEKDKIIKQEVMIKYPENSTESQKNKQKYIQLLTGKKDISRFDAKKYSMFAVIDQLDYKMSNLGRILFDKDYDFDKDYARRLQRKQKIQKGKIFQLSDEDANALKYSDLDGSETIKKVFSIVASSVGYVYTMAEEGIYKAINSKENKRKVEEMFNFQDMFPEQKIKKMNELIEKFTKLRDNTDSQQTADKLQKLIENLKKTVEYEKQINKLIKERANLRNNEIKKQVNQYNLLKSSEWMKQDDIDKQMYNFNKQREWDNADNDVERRRILQKRLSDYQTSIKNLNEANDEIASKRYGNETQKSQNAIRIQELEDFSAFIGRLKEKQDTYAGLKGKSGFEFYESILKIMNKEIPYVEKNYKDQGAGFKKEDRKQWETWLIESKQRRNVLESLLKNIDPNLSNQEKGAIVEQRLKRQIDSRKNKVFLFDDERAKDSAQIAKNETQIKKIMLQELKIKKQMEELDKRRQEYFGSLVRNNDWEEEKFRAQVKGDWDSYLGDEVQIQDNNSKMNMTMDEKLSWMQQKRRERNLNVRRMIKGQAESMYDSMLPNTYENDVERTVRELEKANKITLQPDMVDKIRQLLKIKWDKQDAENYFNSIRGELNIKTNSLTARGGFAGGAYVPKIDDYQRNTVILQRQTNTNLTQIKQLIKDLGKI